MLLDPVPEALLGDAEQPRRAHLHTTRASERREDQLTLEVVDRLVERAPGWRRALLDAGRLDRRRKVLGQDDPVGQKDRALEDVLQLADVARPRVHPQALQRVVGQRRRRPGQSEPGPIEEGVDELGQIVEALAQRREPELDSAQAIEQVRSEPTLVDELAQGLVRRGDDSNVDVDRPAAPDPLDLALLERAQDLRLHDEGHVADLVEEQRPAAGQLEPSDPRADGAREGATLVAEQLGFEEPLQDRKSTRLNSSHGYISYAVFCLKKKKK